MVLRKRVLRVARHIDQPTGSPIMREALKHGEGMAHAIAASSGARISAALWSGAHSTSASQDKFHTILGSSGLQKLSKC